MAHRRFDGSAAAGRLAGHSLCAYHWLKEMLDRAAKNGSDKLFSRSSSAFVQDLRKYAAAVGLPEHDRLGSHALRRGMARDILDAGGSLAALLKAGDWKSAAYVVYLRENQAEESAISRLVVDHSDSE